MVRKTIETNVIIAEKEELFFKEVVFDFDALPPQIGTNGLLPNVASRLFKIQNIDESVEVKAYPTRDCAIMFNAWITKNISYKIAAQVPKENTPIPPTPFPGDNPIPPTPPASPIEMVGVGIEDAAGYPTVYGPLHHMTKVIDFGGFVKLDLPFGEKLRETDTVEVVCAEIVGTHDELLNPEPIQNQHSSTSVTYQEVEIPLPPNPLDPDAPPQTMKIIVPVPVATTSFKPFDPPLTQYARLREKMCIKIKVRVIRKECVDINS
ncbi:hypothetical protein [Clostridium sp. YIM B02551]|uniref:hypothetical protein n=1 Tax=Clostridium sp. YIM B02551 TaxID=2910679 RepID=UPI001EEB7EB5|nr:hypothetical protein [Clostridium sp. YIM B02551]